MPKAIKDREPDGEQSSTTEAVAQGCAEHEQDREGEGVGAHRPFEVLEAATEVLPDGWEGSGDDQVVECGDESGQAGDDYGPDGAAGPSRLLRRCVMTPPFAEVIRD
jgi:hypothetical protein